MRAESHEMGGVSGACFEITAYGSLFFLDEVLDFEKREGSIPGNVETRATRATHAQHWLDALLDDQPVIDAPPPEAEPPGHKSWRISVPGRAPFELTCMQGTTRDALLARYPAGTTAEAMP